MVMSEVWQTDAIIGQTARLTRSLKHWTGRDLVAGVGDEVELARLIYEAPFVLVSHGTETDPVLNYGNLSAQRLWELTWEELVQMPSRFTAEAPDRAERARLLDAVTRNGFIDDYSGIRIAKSGRRFRILRATVWNVIDESGASAGQAAMFDQWEPVK